MNHNMLLNPNQSLKQETTIDPDHILNIIRKSGCSARLFNAVNLNSDHLPVNTVRDYMKAPENARNGFLNLYRFGLKSVDELDQIMRCFKPDQRFETSDGKKAFQKAMQAVERFFSNLRYPDELFEWTISARLTSFLEAEREKHSAPFLDFLINWHKTTDRMLSKKNCGQKTIDHLDEVISRLIKARLLAFGADKELDPHLRRLIRGVIPPEPVLNDIIELGNLQLENIQTTCTISEIITIAISMLDERSQDVLKRRYGIEPDGTETLAKIGARYDITRERVRGIENTAKKNIATNQTVKSLVTAIEQEHVLEKFFKNRKIVSGQQIKLIRNALKAEERLGIDLAYGKTEAFLDAKSTHTKAGWIQEQDLTLIDHQQDNLSDSLKQRILSTIREQHLPVRLSKIISAIPDYPSSTIKNELSEKLKFSFDGDIMNNASRLPRAVQCILILRDAGCAMNCKEIQTRLHEVFGKDDCTNHIRSTLGFLKEAILVERGKFELYENLDLTHCELTEIWNRTFDHLQSIGGFISAKILFSRLFQKEAKFHEADFGPYMLLGILRRDERFATGMGLMVGLASEDRTTEFRTFGEDILAVLSESGCAMKVSEIADAMKDRREVLTSSFATRVKNLPEVISVGRGRFDLAARVAEHDESQAG